MNPSRGFVFNKVERKILLLPMASSYHHPRPLIFSSRRVSKIPNSFTSVRELNDAWNLPSASIQVKGREPGSARVSPGQTSRRTPPLQNRKRSIHGISITDTKVKPLQNPTINKAKRLHSLFGFFWLQRATLFSGPSDKRRKALFSDFVV
jgi:hypothetical protein